MTVKKGKKIKSAKFLKKSRRFGLKKNAAAMYQEAKAGFQTMEDMDGKSEAEQTVALMDAAYAGAKIRDNFQRMKLKAAIKPEVMIGKGYYKAIRRIRAAKKGTALMNAGSAAVIEVPYKVSRGPVVRSSGRVGESTGQKRKTEQKEPVKLVKTPEPFIRNAAQYDISSLEEKHGISSGKKLIYVQAKNSCETLEQKNKVRSKEEEGKEKRRPKKREKPEGSQKTEHTAEKNKVRSKKQKDNLKKKRKSGKKKNANTSGAVMKHEMKLFVMKQVLAEGNDSGVGQLAAATGKAYLKDRIKNAAKWSGKMVRKLTKKLLTLLLGLLCELAFFLLTTVFVVVGPVLLMIASVVCVVGVAATLVGLFVSPADATKDDFAVTLIQNYQSELLENAQKKVGTTYKGKKVEQVNIIYEGIDSIDANSDDILLAYFVEATNENKFDEDDSQAPLLNVNTSNEKKAMKAVLAGMLYQESVTYSLETRTVYVTVTPTPTMTPIPSPATSITPIPVPPSAISPTPTPEAPAMPAPVPAASPAPAPVPEVVEVTESYYVVDIIISGKSAEEWSTNHFSEKEKEVYDFLLTMFQSFGYTEKGGDNVCKKYQEASLE